MLTISIFIVTIALLIVVYVFRVNLPAWLTVLPLRLFNYLKGKLGTINAWLVIILATMIIMMVDSILTGWVWLVGVVFILGLTLTWVTWLRLKGMMRTLLGVSQAAAFNTLRTIIAIMAFVGFIGVIFPGFIGWGLLAGGILVAFIFSVSKRKGNPVDKLIIPVTIFIIAVLAWQLAFPEGFRSSTRYIASWSKVFNTTKDRGSINNETEAATTYAIALKDISVLYEIDEKGVVTLVDGAISKGDTLRLASHREEVIIVEGQGLLKIQLRNEKGTFLNGPRYWVEAEFVQIASPREIVKRDSSKKSEPSDITPQPTPTVSQTFPDYSILNEGRMVFNLKAGEETPWFGFKAGRIEYGIQSTNFDYTVKVSDGSSCKGEAGGSIPIKHNCYYKIVANSDQIISLRVSYL